MGVERFLVRLYNRRTDKRLERETSLSLSNRSHLRELLEDMVLDHVGEQKMRRTDLSNGWALRIYRVNRSGGARGRAIATVTVNDSGDIEVVKR
jgi:hypothetical protein